MDKELRHTIKQCLKKERRAQFKLYQYCYPFLMKICFRYQKQHEDAEALLNDGFLKILLSLETFDSNHAFDAWAATIMMRTAIDQYRSEKKYKAKTDLENQESVLEQSAVNDKHFAQAQQMTAEDVKELLFSLPEELRMVFNLYEVEGFQHKEITQIMGISLRTSKRYLKKAKIILKEKVEHNAPLKKVI